MPFCPISGKPVVLDNPVKTLVLSVDGEPQHFCCPGHEKRYLRENPGARKVTLHVPLASSPQLGVAVARVAEVGEDVGGEAPVGDRSARVDPKISMIRPSRRTTSVYWRSPG